MNFFAIYSRIMAELRMRSWSKQSSEKKGGCNEEGCLGSVTSYGTVVCPCATTTAGRGQWWCRPGGFLGNLRGGSTGSDVEQTLRGVLVSILLRVPTDSLLLSTSIGRADTASGGVLPDWPVRAVCGRDQCRLPVGLVP